MGFFQARRESEKGMTQNNALNIFQHVGLLKVNDEMLCKEIFNSVLSSYGMSNSIVRSTSPQVSARCRMIALHACEFPSTKRKTGDSSVIDAPL